MHEFYILKATECTILYCKIAGNVQQSKYPPLHILKLFNIPFFIAHKTNESMKEFCNLLCHIVHVHVDYAVYNNYNEDVYACIHYTDMCVLPVPEL